MLYSYGSFLSKITLFLLYKTVAVEYIASPEKLSLMYGWQVQR